MTTTIGKRIKALRNKCGMTQEQLGNVVGVTYQAVSKWENDISAPDIQLLSAISDALGVTVDELLNGQKEETIKEEEKRAEDKAGHEETKRAYFGSIPGIVNKDIHGDVGRITGTVNGDIYGDVKGTIMGNINGTIHGDVYGTIMGDAYEITGNVHGSVWGTIRGSIGGYIGGSLWGVVLGDVKGGVHGKIRGQIRGAGVNS